MGSAIASNFSCRSLAHAADYGQVVSLVVVVRLKLDGRDFNGI